MIAPYMRIRSRDEIIFPKYKKYKMYNTAILESKATIKRPNCSIVLIGIISKPIIINIQFESPQKGKV